MDILACYTDVAGRFGRLGRLVRLGFRRFRRAGNRPRHSRRRSWWRRKSILSALVTEHEVALLVAYGTVVSLVRAGALRSTLA